MWQIVYRLSYAALDFSIYVHICMSLNIVSLLSETFGKQVLIKGLEYPEIVT
jgi:hypothetical protein